MSRRNRRQFLVEVGQGMLVGSLGVSLAHELGVATAHAAEPVAGALSFGELEPLVALMQETPPDELMAKLVDRLREGTDLKTLTAAGALANARTFGGEDYIGFHTFMALAPALRMAALLPTELQPLPVLKVLYRNAARIQDFGGRSAEVLHPVTPGELAAGAPAGEQLRAASRAGDMQAAEATFAALAQGSPGEAFHHLQFAVEDEVDVHRVVLAWRGWDTLEIAGPQWAHCLLRQSVHYCVSTEQRMAAKDYPRCDIRTVLPKLLDEHRLAGHASGDNTGDDAWLKELAHAIYSGTREQAADAVAQALRAGYAPASIGEALSLAANWLVLHDPGRIEQWANADKPVGSCHGDSVGVHASDAANAWRNIVRVCPAGHVAASLIVGAFHTGGQTQYSRSEPYPLAEHLAEIKARDEAGLLAELDAAVRGKQQFLAAAAAARYGQLGFDSGQVFDLLLRYAASEDGALHAEKYFHTVREEFANSRPAFRWNQVTALARVTASEYGKTAPGYVRSRELLGV